jgi:hypothetical protein
VQRSFIELPVEDLKISWVAAPSTMYRFLRIDCAGNLSVRLKAILTVSMINEVLLVKWGRCHTF